MRVDIGDTESEGRIRDRLSSAKLLAKLKAEHPWRPFDTIDEIVIPEPPEPLPPIPNEVVRHAAEVAFSLGTIGKVETIQRAVIAYYPDVTMNDIKSPRRDAKVIKPRQVAMYLTKLMTMRSLPDIGRRFGGRDHTTVLHAVRKIERLIKTDAKLAFEVNAISASLEVA